MVLRHPAGAEGSIPQLTRFIGRCPGRCIARVDRAGELSDGAEFKSRCAGRHLHEKVVVPGQLSLLDPCLRRDVPALSPKFNE